MSSNPAPATAGLSPADALRLDAAEALDEALRVVHERRGIDFTGYRRGTLERRFVNRMVGARVTDVDAYLALLRDSESEVDRLAANFTIKVSHFYRNGPVFDLLRSTTLPMLLAEFGAPLRTWSAGCAGGEEPYTLALLLGDSGTVHATDIDDDALTTARRAVYPTDALLETPEELQPAFVREIAPGSWQVNADVASRVSFLRHDLAMDNAPPDPRGYHLVCCRNVLIYFSRALQLRALHLLVASLVPGGVLCLGEAEWPLELGGALEVLDRKRKLFRRPRA